MNDLHWGETPWDTLSRDELLREVQRMASALISSTSVLRMAQAVEKTSLFYSPGGSGGIAVAKSEAALARLKPYGDEAVYRAFFHYADDLLFDDPSLGVGWAVCPVCGRMYGTTMDGRSSVGRVCSEILGLGTCAGVLRPIAWDDLKPKREESP